MQRWSPSLFVKEFHTPTLVIHGELDYRVPVGQGLQLFTALQMQKVPSKLLLFPDEGHWVLKPQNSLLWYKTLSIGWIPGRKSETSARYPRLFVGRGAGIACWCLSSGTVLETGSSREGDRQRTPVQVRIDKSTRRAPHHRLPSSRTERATPSSTCTSRRTAYCSGAAHEAPADAMTFPVGKQQAPALHDGKARLIDRSAVERLAGQDGSTRARRRDQSRNRRALSADGAQHYINQGGCELVAFTISGVRGPRPACAWANTLSAVFRIPVAPTNERFSLFAYPWDLPADTVPVVYARNPAGAEATARFWYKIFPKKFRSRDLKIDDAFLEKVVNQIDPGGSGDLLARFLKINGEMRRKNNQTLADLRLKTADRFLWIGPFPQLANRRWNRISPTSAAISTKARRWMSRCISASIWP